MIKALIAALFFYASPAGAQVLLPNDVRDPELLQNFEYLYDQIQAFKTQVSSFALIGNITYQGNTFNGASQLVQLDGSIRLPAVDGSQLTNLTGANVAGNIAGAAGLNVLKAGDTMTGALTVTGTSVTASAFFGDGSHLTGLPGAVGEQPTYSASSKTFTNSVGLATGGQAFNVAIGTNNARALFHVQGSSVTGAATPNAGTMVLLDGKGGNSFMEFRSTSNLLTGIYFTDDVSGTGRIVYNYQNDRMTFNTNTIERLRMDATVFDVDGASQFGTGIGKSTFSATGTLTVPTAVGIKSNSPASTFEVGSASTGSMTMQIFVTSSPITNIGALSISGNSNMIRLGASRSVADVDTGLAFMVDSNAGIFEAARLNGGTGYLGVGTSAPGSLLHVSGVSTEGRIQSTNGNVLFNVTADNGSAHLKLNRSDTAAKGAYASFQTAGSADWYIGHDPFGTGTSSLAFVTGAGLVKFFMNPTTGNATYASDVSLTMSGSAGTITNKSSVTASAFFGDGSHLTGISGGHVLSTGTTALASQFPQRSTMVFDSSFFTLSDNSAGNETFVSLGGTTTFSVSPETHTVISLPITFSNTSFGACVAGSTITLTTGGGGLHIFFSAPISNDSGAVDAFNILLDGNYLESRFTQSATNGVCSGDATNGHCSFSWETPAALSASAHTVCLQAAVQSASIGTLQCNVSKCVVQAKEIRSALAISTVAASGGSSEGPTYSASSKTFTLEVQVGGPGQATAPTTLNVDGTAQFGSGVNKSTFTGSATSFALLLSSGINAPTGVILSTAIVAPRIFLDQLFDRDGSNFFDGGCNTGEAVQAITNTGLIQCGKADNPTTYYSSVTYHNNTLFDSHALHVGSSVTLTGSNGYITSGSSINASGFFGASGQFGSGATQSTMTVGGIADIATAIYVGSPTLPSGVAVFKASGTNAADNLAVFKSFSGQDVFSLKNDGGIVISTLPFAIPANFGMVSDRGIRIGSSAFYGTDYMQVDQSGILSFIGGAYFGVGTGRPAFCALLGPQACFRFDANANGGFNITDTNRVQTWRMLGSGVMNVGLFNTNKVSTFSALGDLTIPGNFLGKSSGTVNILSSLTGNFSTSLGISSATQTHLFDVGAGTFSVYGEGHVHYGGTAPAITTCGTGSPASNGNDNIGTITIGGGVVTACTITFANPWPATPVCTFTAGAAAIISVTAQSRTAVTIASSLSVGSGIVNYQCMGIQ